MKTLPKIIVGQPPVHEETASQVAHNLANKSSSTMEAIFDRKISKQGRIRLSRQQTTYRMRQSRLLGRDDGSHWYPINPLPLHRQLIDLIGTKNHRRKWNIQIGSSVTDDIRIAFPHTAQTFLSILWGYFHKDRLCFKVKILRDESVTLGHDGEWINAKTGETHIMHPGDDIEIKCGDKVHLVQLPHPLFVSDFLREIKQAYAHFNLPLTAYKSTAKSVVFQAMHQTHPDRTQADTAQDFQDVLEFWKKIQWYNQW